MHMHISMQCLPLVIEPCEQIDNWKRFSSPLWRFMAPQFITAIKYNTAEMEMELK